MSKKKETKKEETKGEVTAQNIKDIIGALNKFLKSKKMTLCVIGKNKTTGMKNFEAMIDSLDEAVAEKLPGKVIDFYNDNFGEEEGEEEDTKKSDKKKDAGKKDDKKADKKDDKKANKPKKEKAESNEAMTVRLLMDGKTDKEISSEFITKYKKLGKDKEFAQKRADKYINQERKKLIASGDLDAPEEEDTKKSDKKKDAGKKTDKKADKKDAGKKSDKKGDKKSDKKTDKKGKKSTKKGK